MEGCDSNKTGIYVLCAWLLRSLVTYMNFVYSIDAPSYSIIHISLYISIFIFLSIVDHALSITPGR